MNLDLSIIPADPPLGVYRMDPETDDLCFADELENGMLVYPYQTSTALVGFGMPRWCFVTKLRVLSNDMRFIGVHADGVQVIKYSEPGQGWYVKKSTIPQHTNDDESLTSIEPSA